MYNFSVAGLLDRSLASARQAPGSSSRGGARALFLGDEDDIQQFSETLNREENNDACLLIVSSRETQREPSQR